MPDLAYGEVYAMNKVQARLKSKCAKRSLPPTRTSFHALRFVAGASCCVESNKVVPGQVSQNLPVWGRIPLSQDSPG